MNEQGLARNPTFDGWSVDELKVQLTAEIRAGTIRNDQLHYLRVDLSSARNELENMQEIEQQLRIAESKAEAWRAQWIETDRALAAAHDQINDCHAAELVLEVERLNNTIEGQRSMLDLVRRVQRQETSMKITAQRALDDAQKRIAHLEAQDRATVNACNERHNVWGPRPPLGDLRHGRVEELMVANRTLAAASERPAHLMVGSRDTTTGVTTITWGSGEVGKYVDYKKFYRMGVSREEIIDEVARLKGLLHVAQDNLNRRDQNPYKRITELTMELSSARKHLAASRKLRVSAGKRIRSAETDLATALTDREHWLRSFNEANSLGQLIADWAYDVIQQYESFGVDRKVWNAIEDLRTRPEGS